MIVRKIHLRIPKFINPPNITKVQANYLFHFFLLGALFSTIKYAEHRHKNIWQKITTQSSDQFINSLKNKKCVVMLQSAKDNTRAFDFIQNMISDQFYTLENHNIPFIFRKIHNCSEINDLFKKIKKNSNEINSLIIAGHGNPDSIEMGTDSLTASKLAFQMPKFIILLSCSTGKEKDLFDMSLARKISLLNPNTTVIAAKEDINTLNTSLTFDFIQDKAQLHPVPIVHFEKPFLSTLATIKNAVKDMLNEDSLLDVNSKFNIEDLKPMSFLKSWQLHRNGTNAFKNGFAIEVPNQKNFP